MKTWKATGCVLLAGIFWGSMGLFVRQLNAAGLYAIDVMQLRVLASAIFVGLYLLLFDTTPRVFYVSEFGWVASLIFLRILQATLSTPEERTFRCRRAWLAPAFGVPLLACYCAFGDILSNLIWCGMMIWLSFCAIRGLVYAKTQTGAARNMRYFHIGVLYFAFAEYLLWTVGCFWPDTSPASPTFWCDMLLTLAILGLLPATRRTVEA